MDLTDRYEVLEELDVALSCNNLIATLSFGCFLGLSTSRLKIDWKLLKKFVSLIRTSFFWGKYPLCIPKHRCRVHASRGVFLTAQPLRLPLGSAVSWPRPCVKAKARLVALPLKIRRSFNRNVLRGQNAGRKRFRVQHSKCVFRFLSCLRFSYVSYVKSNFLVSQWFLLREVLDWVDLEFTETAFRPGQADIVMMSDVSPRQKKNDVKAGESFKIHGEKKLRLVCRFFLFSAFRRSYHPWKMLCVHPSLEIAELLWSCISAFKDSSWYSDSFRNCSLDPWINSCGVHVGQSCETKVVYFPHLQRPLLHTLLFLCNVGLLKGSAILKLTRMDSINAAINAKMWKPFQTN